MNINESHSEYGHFIFAEIKLRSTHNLNHFKTLTGIGLITASFPLPLTPPID
jgi:hypothetical protein